MGEYTWNKCQWISNNIKSTRMTNGDYYIFMRKNLPYLEEKSLDIRQVEVSLSSAVFKLLPALFQP